MDAVHLLFHEFGFEEIGAPFLLPDKSTQEASAPFYQLAVSTASGTQRVFLRTFGTEFSLIPDPAYRIGLRRVFSLGPGIDGGREIRSLGLAQWMQPDVVKTEQLLQRLSSHVVKVAYSIDRAVGRHSLRVAFVPRS